jgi:hypothetical protein
MVKARLSKNNSGPFFALVLICVAFPGFATAKAFSIVGFWIYCLFKSGFKIPSVIWFLSVLSNLLIWSVVAANNAVVDADIINQCSRILIFFIVLGIGVYAARLLKLEEGRLDSLIFDISLIAMLLKVIILTLVLSGWVTLEEIEKYIGFETVTDLIGLGLQRLQFPSDIIIIFLLPCYLGGKNKAKDAIFLLSITLIVLLSFSRFLFAAYFFCLILRYLWIRKVDLISRASIVVIVSLIAIFFASLSTRFSGEGANDSDDVRVEQMRYLENAISNYPLFGAGIGSSISDYKRSNTLPFSYEVQWYAMTMQFGFIGIIWFGVNLVVVLFAGVKSRKQALFFAAVFFMWIASGFTNPYITSLGSAFGFTILMLRLLSHRSSNLHTRDTTLPLVNALRRAPGNKQLG